MSENLNLDINTYDQTELLNLFNYSNKDNAESLHDKYNSKINSLENIHDSHLKKSLHNFFQIAFSKLSNIIKNKNLEEKKNRVFKNTPITFQTTNSSLEETMKMHPSPPIRENTIYSNNIIKYPKGQINPIEKKITSEILCIDTIFRNQTKFPNSSDFVYELQNPIENVISMKLINAEIPKISKLFSKEKNNNRFDITMYYGFNYNDFNIEVWDKPKTLQIIIPDGSPTFSELVSSIQSTLDTQRNSFSFLKFDIDKSSNGKGFFRFKTLVECIAWSQLYYKDVIPVTPPDNRPPTQHFRMPSVNISSSKGEYEDLEYIYKGKIWSEENNLAVLQEFKLNKQLFVTSKGMFDFSKNFISYDLYNTYPSNFRPLTYSIDFNPTNTQTEYSAGWILGFRQFVNESSFTTKKIDFNNCFCRDDIHFLGYVEGISPYGDAENTYNFLYVDDFVGNYKDSLNVAIKNSYLTRSLLAKIQMNTPVYTINFMNTSGENSILEKKREYFGPVNIKKLHFKIIDKFNNIVDFDKSNFSLTLQFEKLYNNIRN